jgi:hypothetical protein
LRLCDFAVKIFHFKSVGPFSTTAQLDVWYDKRY